MGDPIDDAGGGGPGEGWEYCFSSAYNDLGPLTSNLDSIIPANNFGNGNPSMDSSWTYQPESSFNELVGCPLNGDWTIFVQDNLGVDDGWIFESKLPEPDVNIGECEGLDVHSSCEISFWIGY